MNKLFAEAFNYVVGLEGAVFTNDPVDSGGPTKYGITQETYEIYKGKEASLWEIETMTEDDAREIYEVLYWNRMKCGELKSRSIALCLFSSAVLYGNHQAGRMAQRAANICGGTLKVDGILGDNSVATLNAVNSDDFISAFHGLLIKRIEELVLQNPKNIKYRKGWTNRADKIKKLLQ